MTCNEIEKRLPAYREGVLSPAEGKDIAGHLASCPRCSRAVAELERAEKLLQGLAEVEPPPFFEQRILSRVREEAGRKRGILRRLFYPLRIKLPLQALATIVVAVLAFHVYQQGDPEMERTAPLPAPLTEQGTGGSRAGTPGAPASPPAAAPFQRPPAGDLREAGPPRSAASPIEKLESKGKSADSRAAVREEIPAAAKPAAPVLAARQQDAPPAGAEGPDGVRDRAGKQDAAEATATLPQEPKRREKAADTGAASGEGGPAVTRLSPSRMTEAAIHRSAMELAVQARDPEAALREIESRLDAVSGRIIERQRRSEGVYLKVEIAARNIAALQDLLTAVGKVHPETVSSAVPSGWVTVGITVAPLP